MSDIVNNILFHSPALIVAIPLLGAFLTPIMGKINTKLRNIVALLIVIITASLIFLLASDVLAGNIHTYVFGGTAKTIVSGNNEFAIRVLFEVDAMSIFMAIIAGIISVAAVIYSWAFMKKETGLDKYYTLLLLMIAGMLGMMLTGDMFNFFVFLEITSIASCALIAFWTNKGRSVDAGFKYIVVSSIGALFVLFSIAILYGQYNALNMAVLANSIQYTFLDKIALGLLIAGLAMKAGIVPMHMWLPDAYGRAPSSVTLLLIGATQASLYGMLRILFTVYGNSLDFVKSVGDIDITTSMFIGIFLLALAIATIFIGVLMALKQSDFKRTIGFAAVAEIGYMILAIGAALVAMNTEYGATALNGGIFHIINDVLDVGLLFLVAGAIYYATKETSLNKLGGLARNMKYTTVFFIIGLLAISGMPPLNGFASKLLIYESTFYVNPILSIIAILCSILLLAVFVKVFHSAFLGPKQAQFDKVKEVPITMLFAMGIISVVIVFFGLFPDYVINNLIEPAANALMNHSNYISQVIGGVTA